MQNDQVNKEGVELALTALISLYSEHRQRVNHYQEQRSSLTTHIVTIAGAMLAALSTGLFSVGHGSVLGLALVVLGLFGARFTALHHRKIRESLTFTRQCERQIACLVPQAELAKVWSLAKKVEEEGKFRGGGLLPNMGLRLNSWLRARWMTLFGRPEEYVSDYWVLLQILIAVAGVVVLFQAALQMM